MVGFFGGRVVFKGSCEHTVPMLNLLLEGRLPYDSFCRREDCFFLTVSHRVAEQVCRLSCERGIPLFVEERRGLPAIWQKYKKRVGLMIGAVLASLMVWLSSCVVWDVRVTGNQRLEKSDVEAMLDAYGLAVGTYIPRLDTDLVEARVLLQNQDICWISINMKGTTANVEILETEKGQLQADTATDLVATRDGLISRIEIIDGNVCVKVGDAVKEGMVLVSGIYEGGHGALRVTRAQGEVYARTVREFFVEIPYHSTKKVYTGRKWSQKSIKFFTNRIKVFTNTGNAGATCDIIYDEHMLTLPRGVEIPLGMETVRYLEYCRVSEILSADEAMDRAFEELEEQLCAFVSETGAELLQKKIVCDPSEYAYRLHCTIICIENIACEKEIDIN